MNHYTPFKLPFERLTTQDLMDLRVAAEGWYIEYKREASKPDAMAKSVSAFANTHGGWIFYGVTEKSKEEAVAGEFPGISKDEVDGCLQRLRQAVANALNPTPHFDVKVLWGPCEQIGLEADRAVICVHVSKGMNSPYVHKNGQIFRRVADGSEPRPENDRFVLDQLWQRSKEIRAELSSWIEADPAFSDSENLNPCIRVLLCADLWRDRGAWLDTSIDEFRSLLRGPNSTALLPFDNIHTTSDGFIARQLKGNNPFGLSITLKVRRNLDAELIIPLNINRSQPESQLVPELLDYENIKKFCSLLSSQGHTFARVVDFNFVLHILVGLTQSLHNILERAKWHQSYHSKSVLINFWRTVPFIDSSKALDTFAYHGLPMIMDRRIISPPSNTPNSFAEVERHEDKEPHARSALQALTIFRSIADACGIPLWLPEAGDDGLSYIEELFTIGNSAVRAQTARLARAQNN